MTPANTTPGHMTPDDQPETQVLRSSSEPVLYPWDVNPAVAEVQELLYAQGFPLRIDGDFGSRTETAIKTFQRQHGLAIDGVVDAKTWQALKTHVRPGGRTLKFGRTGADVFELQGLLQVLGYEIDRTGLFDAKTRSAVLAFQKQHQLQPTGLVDAVTWALLGERQAYPKARKAPTKLAKRRFS